jgi:hypothetical protein
MDGVPEVGGERPKSAGTRDEAGERTGDGERFAIVDENDACKSFVPLSWACSPWTTSAKEMKLNLLTSDESIEP